jgi:biopolymer transport protein ExbD
MAENISEERNTRTKSSFKKAIRVDLTPMVDLGFLLITFFVFTSSMSAPKAMAMVMPDDKSKINDPICESCAITVIPAGGNKIFYYEGTDKTPDYKTTTYNADGLRTLLLKKKRAAALQGLDAILIIKPTSKSSFKNLINIIDESTIAMYKRYYLDKLDADHEKLFE